MNIWLRELETGKESPVASSALLQRFPSHQPIRRQDRVLLEKLMKTIRDSYMCLLRAACRRSFAKDAFGPRTWSSDESSLLIFSGDPYQEIEPFSMLLYRANRLRS